jgi:hypothetical protein
MHIQKPSVARKRRESTRLIGLDKITQDLNGIKLADSLSVVGCDIDAKNVQVTVVTSLYPPD